MTTPTEFDIPAAEQLPGVSRTTAIDLVTRVLNLYTSAEQRIAADISRRLAAGQESPKWAQDKLEQSAQMRRQTAFVLSQLKKDTSREVTYAVISAYLRGGAEAARALKRIGMGFDAHPDEKLRRLLDGPQSGLTKGLADLAKAFPGIASVMRLAANLVLRIEGTHLPVLRWADDIYRKVISETALSDVAGGLATRRRASQKAWEAFLGEGVKGFTDKAGKRWNLATYVEMATRAGVMQALVEGHLERLDKAGIDLVIVSNAPQECIKCRPWEGKVLAVKGKTGSRTVKVQSARNDDIVEVHIAGTVEEAILAGLMHPNCRHTINAYVPGVTRIPTHTEDPEGDAARQHLRHLERKVRKEKLQAVSAIDPVAKREHEAKARGWQGKIREHVAATEHLGIFRKPERERLNLGHTAPPDAKTAAPAPSQTPSAPPAAPVSARVSGNDLTEFWRGEAGPNMDTLIAERARYETGETYGDHVLGEIVRHQDGWGNPATVVNPKQLDTAISGGWRQLWRGQSDSFFDEKPAREVTEAARTGPWLLGEGNYGNGFYASERRATAEEYRQGWINRDENQWGPAPLYEWQGEFHEGNAGGMLRMALDPAAKVGDWTDMQAGHDRYIALVRSESGAEAADIVSDFGHYAALLGYDAVFVPGGEGFNDGGLYPPGVSDKDEPGQWIIFNRSVLLMEEASDRYDT